MALDANGLRKAFTGYFVDRGHLSVPGAGLVPHDPSVMFNIAGMVQFKPYFTGEEPPPAPRATSIQPCFRMVDIDIIGTTARHATFFEMLGNFSFGDYFKEQAIPLAWEFVTNVCGFDPERLWVTVHESDTDASGIWQEAAGVPSARIQRMGEDNFWRMGDIGPCGPCSEIYYDRGPAYGPEGGPAHGGDARYVEIWNLVFMQFERLASGELVDLPRKNIDTGAGLERMLVLLEGVESIFETDVIAPVLEEAARLTRTRPGEDPQNDIALRIIADHARAMTFLVSDGVFPTNEARGYVLRRVIRRLVLRAHQLGMSELITPLLVGVVSEVMSEAYPKLVRDRSLVETVVAHEEEAFRRTLRQGRALFDAELATGTKALSGEVAFRLHDTYGFPIDLTEELAAAQGVTVDRASFDLAMSEQRERARQADRSRANADDEAELWRSLLEEFGPTDFVGYRENATSSRVLAVRHRDDAHFENIDGQAAPQGAELLDIVLDVTPFYAEGGGQVGDTGIIEAPTGVVRILDTTRAIEGVIRHTGYLLSGELEAGAEVSASIDTERRAAIRRNHTATHLLHGALRSLLGGHVQQKGSLVAPDRLRFDFNHFSGLSKAEITEIERIVNEEILTNESVRTYETTRLAAQEAGAVAIFGEKYGDVVRVVEAGDFSTELCGGTHVGALGMIGPFRILSEASIGANTRRIEATTGLRTIEDFNAQREVLESAAEQLHTAPNELADALVRTLEHQHQLEDELRAIKASQSRSVAGELAATATNGRVVARVDGLDPNALRELALAIRDHEGIDAVGLIGASAPDRVGLVVATRKSAGIDAKAVAADAAGLLGGGGGGSPELATAGGRDVAAIDQAKARLDALLS
jgi:alanyl-tRNA synthetase